MSGMPERNPPAPYKSVSRVTGNLFVGAEPPEGDTLRKLGFSMVVLSAQEHAPPRSRFPGVEVLYGGLRDDGTERSVDVLSRACPVAARVAAALRARRRVLVTCHWGYNRSAVIAGLALVRMGWAPQAALAQLRATRPAAQGFRALCSPEYERALLQAGCA